MSPSELIKFTKLDFGAFAANCGKQTGMHIAVPQETCLNQASTNGDCYYWMKVVSNFTSLGPEAWVIYRIRLSGSSD